MYFEVRVLFCLAEAYWRVANAFHSPILCKTSAYSNTNHPWQLRHMAPRDCDIPHCNVHASTDSLLWYGTLERIPRRSLISMSVVPIPTDLSQFSSVLVTNTRSHLSRFFARSSEVHRQSFMKNLAEVRTFSQPSSRSSVTHSLHTPSVAVTWLGVLNRLANPHVTSPT